MSKENIDSLRKDFEERKRNRIDSLYNLTKNLVLAGITIPVVSYGVCVASSYLGYTTLKESRDVLIGGIVSGGLAALCGLIPLKSLRDVSKQNFDDNPRRNL